MSDDVSRKPDRKCRMRLKSLGPYGTTWPCGEPRWHLGRHRHRNYTWSRLPQVWQAVALTRTWKANRRLKSYRQPGDPKPGLLRYQRVLHPTRFDPLPTAELSRRLAAEAEEARRG